MLSSSKDENKESDRRYLRRHKKKKTNVELICLCDSSMSVIFIKNLDPQIYTLKPPNSVCVLLLSLLLLLFIISLLSFGAKEIENKNRIRNYQVVIELHK